MIIEGDLNNFISNFYTNFPDFVLRVRKDKKGNIAYYNGNKAFQIREVTIKGEKKVDLKFPLEVYKCNATDLSKCKSKKERAEYRKKIKDICMGMTKIYDFSMSKITFKLSEECDVEKTKEKLAVFYKNSIKYGGEFNLKQIQDDVNDAKEKKKKTLYIKFNEPITNINKIIMVQYYFIYDMLFEGNKKKNNTIKEIKFSDYKAKFKNKKTTEQKEKFIETIKNAINSYTGKEEVEKKYQHQFMLYGHKTNIFKKEKNHTVSHFEQEYNLVNKYRYIKVDGKRKNKTGRIDCVFYKLNEIENKITDIYLIELKVDEGVVLGSNGVMTHLDDIQAIIKDAYEKNNIKWFRKLTDTIRDRLQILNNNLSYELNNSEEYIDYRIHFYTVFGFTKDVNNEMQHRNTVTKYLTYLKDENKVTELCNNGMLEKYFNNSEKNNIYKLIEPIKEKCDVKFYYEKEDWQPDLGTITTEFNDMTKELYNDFKEGEK